MSQAHIDSGTDQASATERRNEEDPVRPSEDQDSLTRVSDHIPRSEDEREAAAGLLLLRNEYLERDTIQNLDLPGLYFRIQHAGSSPRLVPAEWHILRGYADGGQTWVHHQDPTSNNANPTAEIRAPMPSASADAAVLDTPSNSIEDVPSLAKKAAQYHCYSVSISSSPGCLKSCAYHAPNCKEREAISTAIEAEHEQKDNDVSQEVWRLLPRNDKAMKTKSAYEEKGEELTNAVINQWLTITFAHGTLDDVTLELLYNPPENWDDAEEVAKLKRVMNAAAAGS
ncbi:hypothetical protein EJ08DRAFT_661228 [Tothia fuscella]|uniref:Uncharacterized protein n=1 Tax=Tothia fuscella TaxID=1048955 RepID=A0A9P4NQX1_9PEZI|nr:hypothetical protein EJ08DRAFT_661228 [Tothia fuscella]